MQMDYVAVSSSNIAAIAYDDAGRVLGVQFLNGREYRYHGVGRPVYMGFLGAGSKGGYFNDFVKEAYVCTRVR
ncbi:MAG TPA: KTSC domain-containing protein [Longimicrobium sp.]|uniref:KTSC domain-containing protein n=1 Tax=Longimicrobium sp. TaxID=2029185 RepID=UPI002ED97DD6